MADTDRKPEGPEEDPTEDGHPEDEGSALRQARSKVVGWVTAAGGRGGALAILIVLIIGFATVSDAFLSLGNLFNVLRQYSVVLILSVAQTIVIIAAGIDLSVAATAALAGSVAAVTYSHWGWAEPLALMAGLGAGALVGVFNGYTITKWRVPDIIATLGTFTAVRGVALLVTNGLPVPNFEQAIEGRTTMPDSLRFLGAQSSFRVPHIVLVALVAVLIGWFILNKTRLGRTIFAVGGNEEAAHASGIRTGRTRFMIYVISAALSSVAGLMLAGRLSSANALMGTGMELQSIAAVVVGGTALFGGEGSVWGTVIGVLIIGVLANGLTIMGVSEFWQRVLNGLIIVVVVGLDQWRRRVAREQRKKEAAEA